MPDHPALTSPDTIDSPGQRVKDVLLLAVAAALMTGVSHAGVAWVRREVLHDLLRTWMSPDVWWMSPVGYLLVFLPIALVLALLSPLALRRATDRVAAFVFGTGAALGVLLLFPRLHDLAALVLALGLGARFAVAVAGSQGRWRRPFRRWSAALAMVVVTSMLVLTAGRAFGERREMAALPASRPGAPNVLLLILDTVRAQNVGFLGYQRATTPRLDVMAGQGTIFDFAFATAPWTLPSHASIFTGRYASEHTGDWTSPLIARDATLAEVFRDHGYATGGFTANLVATPRGFGLERGFIRYEDFLLTPQQLVLSTALGQMESFRLAWERLFEQRWIGGAVRALAMLNLQPRNSFPDADLKTADQVTGAFLDWQRGLGGRPFFAFLNLFDAHGPYESPAPYDTMFAVGHRIPDKYDRAIRYIDHELGALFDSLDARGVLDSTVVIVTSDHGEQFGEHGLSWHSNSLYNQLVHVPLLIRYPARVPAGRRIARQVSLRDLAMTAADLAGLTATRGLGGHSLAATWTEPPESTSVVLNELSRGVNVVTESRNQIGAMHALVDDSLHFIRSGDGALEIFAYRRDPLEKFDLAKGPHAALAASFEERVRAARRAASALPTQARAR